MKSQEELNALKEEVETLNAKLKELTEEELAQVAGGLSFKNFQVIQKKIDKLLADGKIDTSMHYDILMCALSLKEKSYESFAYSYASIHGLNPVDIMF